MVCDSVLVTDSDGSTLLFPGLYVALRVTVYEGSLTPSLPVAESDPEKANDSNGVDGVGAVGVEEQAKDAVLSVALVGIVPT